MVLEQKMSAMSEHNTQNAGNSDMVSAHSKKMSLATKLKKQRKIRQTGGAESPVPNEGPLIGSKSPVRDSGNDKTEIYPEKAPAAKSPPRRNDAASASSPAPAASAASKHASSGTSLLHNKRRAMHLAKTRRGGPAKGSTTSSSSKAETSSSDSASSTSSGKSKDAYSSYMRKMPAAATTAASRAGILDPAFSSPKNLVKQSANLNTGSAAPHSSFPDNHSQKGVPAPDTKVSEPARSMPTEQPKPSPMIEPPKPSHMVHKPKPQPVVEQLKPSPMAQESEPSPMVHKPKPSPIVHRSSPMPQAEYPKPNSLAQHENKEQATRPEASNKDASEPASSKQRATRPVDMAPPVVSHEEVVPWETEAPTEEPREDCAQDSDKLSQASIGRSVISNGVVDYDESIMSLARLDNFRSKANQTKANKVTQYPGASGGSYTQGRDLHSSGDKLEVNDSGESIPLSATKAAETKRWPTQEQRSSPTRTQSWKAKSSSSTSFVKRENLGSRHSVTTSTIKNGGRMTGRPSWVKPTFQNSKDEAPSSPIPKNSIPHPPVSPARSTFSSASYKHDRPASPYLNMSKFSSSRSDVGVELPAMSSLRQNSLTSKGWRHSSAAKKTTFAPSASAPAKQDEVRAASPTPSWHSVRSEQEHNSCPVSPVPSQASEAESAGEKTASTVPKARVWSAGTKKQPPAWMKRSPSPNVSVQPHAPTSPRRHSLSSWKKPTTHESETPEPKSVAAPAPKSRQSSSTSSIPKPVTTSRQSHGTDHGERAQEQSPRRHSSPAPSWVKPAPDAEDAEVKKEPSSMPKAKTWAVNKQTPSWMKKKNEEPAEKPPAPVPTTKTWSTKKQTPAWLKQSSNCEIEVAPTPSPGRSSTPSWLKPGQQNPTEQQQKAAATPQPIKEAVASGSPQTPGRSKQSQISAQDGEASLSPAKGGTGSTSKSRRTSNQGFVEQRPAPSPRSQSWKPRSPPLNVDKPSMARKGRHSVGGEVAKIQAANFVKKQRSPSPSVAQLQEQIFVTKLGVSGDSNDQPKAAKPQKGPSSPSPQVKQLQQIIFSPDKAKNPTPEVGGSGTSPAAGWWKRVPNAPEVQTEHCEVPPWKHEASSTFDEQSADISPSPTMMSEPLPTKKTWKRPASACAVAPGAPSFLKDVAAFHSNSPKLPAEPPVWQQPSKPAASPKATAQAPPPQPVEPQPKAPTAAANSPLHRNTSSSPLDHNLADEGSSELMVVSSTSTTSRNDFGVQQEDTKSLIQMAADSVLIADYEQAMQRAVVESKSDEEDESVGNSAGNTLPNELPLEFQKALTSEEPEEDKPKAQKYLEATRPAPGKQDVQENGETEKLPLVKALEVEEENETEHMNQHHVEKCSSDPVRPTEATTAFPHSSSAEPMESEPLDTSKEQETNAGEDTSQVKAGVVLGVPSTFGTAGGSGKSKAKIAPNIADRARAILGWAEKRVAPVHTEAEPIAEVVEVIHNDPASEPSPVRGPVPAPSPNRGKVVIHEEAEQVEVANRSHLSNCSDSSNVFGATDPNLTGIEQDENGFPCAPPSEQPIHFGDGGFHADAFGNQEWIDGPEDEKKEASDMLPYWPTQEMDALNDSSEWASRDPGLDSIPMNSPEPVSAENVILTAEKMLQKWSNTVSRQAEPMAPPVFDTAEEKAPAEPEMDGWAPTSPRPPEQRSVEHLAPQENDPWDMNQFAGQLRSAGNARTPERAPPADDVMYTRQEEDEAAWTSPDRIGHQHHVVERQEELAMWGSEQAAVDAWGSPQPDPFSTANGHFDMLSAGAKRPQGDVFDPFGEEGDGIVNFQSGQLFSEPTDDFVAIETFSPPTFASVPGSKRYSSASVADVFDTYYDVSQGYSNTIPLKPVSQEENDDLTLI